MASALVEQLRRDRLIEIAENPTRIVITRTTNTRTGRTDTPVTAPLPEITVRLYEESSQSVREVQDAAGDVKQSARWGVIAPYDAPFTNDTKIKDRVTVPAVGTFDVTEAVPVRHDGDLIGWRAVLVGLR